MRLKDLVIKPFLLAGLLLLAACHDEEKPQPEHEGEGQLIVTVDDAGGQPLTLRIYGEGPGEPLEYAVGGDNPATTLAVWLPVGDYDVLVVPQETEQVAISGTDQFATAVAAVRIPEGTATLPAVDAPVCTAARSGITLVGGEDNLLTLQPKDIRKVVRLTVTAPEGLIAGTINATLSGIAQAVNLADGEVTSGATLGITLPAPDARAISQSSAAILGIVATPDAGPAGNHLLTLTWQSADGKAASYSEDVSAQLYKAFQSGADTLDLAVTATSNVAIRLYTGILTRASIDAFDRTPVCVAVGTASGSYTECWEGIAGNNEITLQPERYYPADGSPVHLRSYYPAAPLENGSVHYTLTGQEDLLLSGEQSGSIANRFHPEKSPLIHRHLLAQLNFKIKLDGASDSYRIRSVKLNGLAQQARVDLFSETVEPIGTAAPIVIYTDPGTGGFPITNGVVSLPGYVLVQPDAELTLDLVINIDGNPAHDKVFTNIPVKFTGGSSEGGSAYEVEISLEVPGNPDTPENPDDPDTPDNPNNPDYPDTPDVPSKPDVPQEPDATDGIKITITAKVTNWINGDNGGVQV